MENHPRLYAGSAESLFGEEYGVGAITQRIYHAINGVANTLRGLVVLVALVVWLLRLAPVLRLGHGLQ